MKLTIHRGTKEIGGSCIELESKGNRIILDIGMPLVDERGEQFDFKPYRRLTGPQLIEKKILPNVPGFYRFNKSDKPPDALLISHPHLDHFGLLNFVKPSIPIYMSKGCHKLIELSYYFNESKFDFSKVEIVAPWKSFSIGSFTIMPYLVDHSGFDALAFMVDAEGKRIFYSGDFRGHGRKHIVFDNMVKKPPENIDYLLLEGSHIGEQDGDCNSEDDVESRLTELLSDKEKLYFIATSSQNIDRIVSIYRACKTTGRTFVIDAYTALILETAKAVSEAIPQHDWPEHMKILFVENRHTKIMQKDGTLERFKKSEVTYEDILKDKGKYIVKDAFAVRNKFAADKNLIDTTLIYSMWDGYLEDDEELRAFWETNKVPIIHIHTSGHAHVADLRKFAEALNSKTIIPIHTFEAVKFPSIFKNVKLLNDGEVFVVA